VDPEEGPLRAFSPGNSEPSAGGTPLERACAPTGGSLGKLRQLELVEFRSSGGWLAVGYQLADRAAGIKSE
jgi:hypothetical protein